MRIKPIAAAAALMAATLSAGYAAAEPTGRPYMGGPDNFGEANRQTMAAQIIDPNPVYPTLVPETSGDHAAQAVDRYRTDKVKKPERLKTSTTITGGSGGGGNSGGN